MSSLVIKICDGCSKEVKRSFLEIKEGFVNLNNGVNFKNHTIGYSDGEIKDKVACSYDCLLKILQRACTRGNMKYTDFFFIGDGGDNLADPNNY